MIRISTDKKFSIHTDCAIKKMGIVWRHHFILNMPTLKLFCLLAMHCLLLHPIYAQDAPKKAEEVALPAKALQSLSSRASSVEGRLDKATDKYLSKLLRQENRLKSKLAKDSLLAHQLFDGVEEKYTALRNTSAKLSKYSAVYSGHLDSLTTALSFLKDKNLISSPELNSTLSQFSSLQERLDHTEMVRKFILQRKQLLTAHLERLGMLGELKGFQKGAWYYSQQVREVKALWEDPDKLERRIMEEVVKLPQFRDFFQKNSQLGSLFALPGSSPFGGGQVGAASLAGLQTRASIQAVLTQRFGSGPQVQQLLQQNLQAAQGQLGELKSKLSALGSGSFGNSSSDLDLPQGFRPNPQKTKTFLQRIEYGANVQSQKARSYFPTTSDIGLSLGYKLSDKSSIGIGASYKIGWGRGWNHLRMTSEGVGLRSYIDWKLKGSLYLSGGYEQNYRNAFTSVQQLRDYSHWQASGLLGLSKKYKVSKKLKGDMKLLWDFLSYQQLPRTQALLFRVGYNWK